MANRSGGLQVENAHYNDQECTEYCAGPTWSRLVPYTVSHRNVRALLKGVRHSVQTHDKHFRNRQLGHRFFSRKHVWKQSAN